MPRLGFEAGNLLEDIATFQRNLHTERRDTARKRHRLRAEKRRVELELKAVEEQLEKLNRAQSDLPLIQAVLASRETIQPQLMGSPVLVWVDRTATTMHGPSLTVFPIPSFWDGDGDEDEDEDEDDESA